MPVRTLRLIVLALVAAIAGGAATLIANDSGDPSPRPPSCAPRSEPREREHLRSHGRRRGRARPLRVRRPEPDRNRLTRQRGRRGRRLGPLRARRRSHDAVRLRDRRRHLVTHRAVPDRPEASGRAHLALAARGRNPQAGVECWRRRRARPAPTRRPRIAPVAILDGKGRDITPAKATGNSTDPAGKWFLTLALDDAKLPLPTRSTRPTTTGRPYLRNAGVDADGGPGLRARRRRPARRTL